VAKGMEIMFPVVGCRPVLWGFQMFVYRQTLQQA